MILKWFFKFKKTPKKQTLTKLCGLPNLNNNPQTDRYTSRKLICTICYVPVDNNDLCKAFKAVKMAYSRQLDKKQNIGVNKLKIYSESNCL